MNKFFEELYQHYNLPEDNYIELRSFDSSNKRVFSKVNTMNSTIKDFMASNESCYFGIALRNSNDSGKKDNCSFLTTLYADIDYGCEGHKKSSVFPNKESAYRHILNVGIQPTVIVESGHGFHLYWFLSSPLELNADNTEMAETLMKALQDIYFADSTHDVSRVFRIPGSINNKQGNNLICTLVKSDYDLRYSIESLKNMIESHPLSALKLGKLDKDYLNKILGHTHPEDRSAEDQSILLYLVSERFNDHQIKAIFDNFPTTGKYLERKEKDPNGAEEYFKHSLLKARNYFNDLLIKKGNKRMTEKKQETKKNSLEYLESDSNNRIGYSSIIYYADGSSQQEDITNFIIRFSNQTRTNDNSIVKSFLEGEIFIEGTEDSFRFTNFSSSYLANAQELKSYLCHLCGPKVAFKGKDKDMLEAIRYFNRSTTLVDTVEFGYNKELTVYFTEDMIISENGFEEKTTPIKHKEIGIKNYHGFRSLTKTSIEEVTDNIIDNLLAWDKPEVIFPAFAYTFVPLIYPFIRDRCGKTYFMLKGPSGCGKTTLANLLQRFYGNFVNLESWSSTDTAIQIRGNALKDSLFVVDDLKLQNLRNGYISKIMTIIQNYSDETGRNRSSKDLDVKNQIIIKGNLFISAEDLVLTEASSIARGIIVYIDKTKLDYELFNKLNQQSIDFKIFTAGLINYILKNTNHINIKQKYDDSVKYFTDYVTENNIGGDNLPRLINNFAQLMTSWQIVMGFIKEEIKLSDESKLNEYLEAFPALIETLFVNNLSRIQDNKPEVKFEETMFQLIEIGTLRLVNYARYHQVKNNMTDIAGFFQIRENGIKVCIKFHQVFDRVVQHLKSVNDEIGHSKQAVMEKLVSQGKMIVNKSATVSFGEDNSLRGVEWVGNIDWEGLGINIDD